jgi:beta-N-acetylhexosaminidase
VGYGDEAADVGSAAAVTVAMDVPYLLKDATSRSVLATYSSSRPAMAALPDVLAVRSSRPLAGRGHRPATDACG